VRRGSREEIGIMNKPLVLIKGGGDIASGVAHGLVALGLGVAMTELAKPSMVRRRVSFGDAVYSGEAEVEGIRGILCPSAKEAFIAAHTGAVAVMVDPTCSSLGFLHPDVLVDARVAKRNIDTKITDAPVVIAVGPGFIAGRDCHAVVESRRGPGLGRVIMEGAAAPNTGRPAEVMGHGEDRVLRSPGAGVFRGTREIGDAVRAGDEIGSVEASGGPLAVNASIAGVLRGLVADGLEVSENQKLGDIDPSGVREKCFSISDKALSVGDGVAEAIRRLAPGVIGGAWPVSRRSTRVQGGGIDSLRRRWHGGASG
jgi:xanthine dehydrogenase accessory factor